MSVTANPRSAWHEKFRTPTADSLLDEISADKQAVIVALRGGLRSIKGLAEQLRWEGVAWRWTLCYRGSADAARAVAYLIPNPETPQLCVPMTSDSILHLPKRRLRKGTREPIESSRVIAGIYWPVWKLDDSTPTEELLLVVEAALSAAPITKPRAGE